MSVGARPNPLHRFEDLLAIAVLAALTLLPLIELAIRRLAGLGIPGSIPVVQHLTLWIAFVGAGLAARFDRLLALSTSVLLPDRLKRVARVATGALGAAVTSGLCVASLGLVRAEREAGSLVGLGVPVWVAVAIMPAGFAVLAGRFVWRAGGWRSRMAAASGLALPWIAALAPALQGRGVVLAGVAATIAATLLGLPIFAAIGGVSLLLFWNDGLPLASIPVEAYRLAASPMLPAVPLFTLGGYILSEGGSSRRLLRFLTAVVGWMPGGLAVATCLMLALFTPLTGASGITILSMGGLLLPVLLRGRYPEMSSVGLVTVSGSIGLLLPPSLPVILYGVTASLSILELFAAGVLPGILLVLLVAGWGLRDGLRARAERAPFRAREAGAAAWESKWELLLPIPLLGSYFAGYATLVEAAALTVLAALVIECFVHRELSVRRDLPRIAVECGTLVGGFLIILAVALGFTNYLILEEVPMRALDFVQTHIESPLLFLLALNVFLIVVGGLMDIYSAIFVVVPLIAPMGAAYGIDPLHLAIVFLANLELGYLTPPMGENLFLAAYRFKKPLPELFRATLPFWIVLLAGVLVITYVPWLSLGLVRALFR
jgi:tripartite ATP-independent transporter DctM subunit